MWKSQLFVSGLLRSIGRATLAQRGIKQEKGVIRLIKHENNKDLFGSLSAGDPVLTHIQHSDLDEVDDGDGEKQFHDKISDVDRPKPVHFLKKVNKLVDQGNIKAALDAHDVEMREEFVKPTHKQFRVLVHGCGKLGYHKKAFQLYKEYKDRGFYINMGMISDLFNACANSPFPKEALQFALQLRQELLDNNAHLPQVTYHTMLKAFGRCGKLEMAFAVVDEMKIKKIPIDEHTYAHLLQVCIQDKNAGFRHAILTWRKLLNSKNLKPDLVLYNLLLRATKECGVGEDTFTSDIITACITQGNKNKNKLLKQGKSKGKAKFTDILNSDLSLIESRKTESEIVEASSTPNLLVKTPDLTNVVSLGPLNKPQDRFLLLGGLHGFCEAMKDTKPDIKSFTMMLDLLQNNTQAEEELVNKMVEMKVNPNTTFINLLIRRRAFRKEHKLARETITMFNQFACELDLVSYGVIAMTCHTKQHMERFLKDMKGQGHHPNVEIMNSLAKTSVVKGQPSELSYILNYCMKEDIKPNPRMLRMLEKYFNDFNSTLLRVERGQIPCPPRLQPQMENNFADYREFRSIYQNFLAKSEVDLPQHPWKQFLTAKDLERAEHDEEIKDIINRIPES